MSSSTPPFVMLRNPGAGLITLDRKDKNLLSKAADGEAKIITSVTGIIRRS